MHRKQGRISGLISHALDWVLAQINRTSNLELRRGVR